VCSKCFEFPGKFPIWSAARPFARVRRLPAAARAFNITKQNTPLFSGVPQIVDSAFPHPRPTGLPGVRKPPLMSSLQRPSPIFACRPDRSIGLHRWLFSAVCRPLRPDLSRLERLCVFPGFARPGVVLCFSDHHQAAHYAATGSTLPVSVFDMQLGRLGFGFVQKLAGTIFN